MNASMYAYRSVYLRRTINVLEGFCEIAMMENIGILNLEHERDFEVIAKYLYDDSKEFGEVYYYVQGRA